MRGMSLSSVALEMGGCGGSGFPFQDFRHSGVKLVSLSQTLFVDEDSRSSRRRITAAHLY